MRRIPIGEAIRLAIYFEETGKYHHAERKRIEHQTPSPSSQAGAGGFSSVELELGGYDEEIEGYDD